LGYHRNQGSSTGSCSSIATYAGGTYGSFVVGSTSGGVTSATFSANNLNAAGDSYTVSLTQTVGGVESDPATFSTTLDVIAPGAPVLASVPVAIAQAQSPASPFNTNSTSAAFTFSASANPSWPNDDAPSSYQCSVDSGSWAGCVSPLSLTSLADGSHSFRVRALDSLGNTGAASSSVYWKVDTLAPASPTLSAPDGSSFASQADVPFSAGVEAGASLLCSIDSGPYVACPAAGSAPGDRSVITVGYNTTLYYGQGSGATTTAIGLLVGGAPSWLTSASLTNPSVATIDGLFGNRGCSAIRSAFLGQSGFAGLVLGVGLTTYNAFLIDCSNTDVATPSQATRAVFKGLEDGVHTLRVRAVDPAGNASDSTAAVSWTVGTPPPPADTTAPDAPLLLGAPASKTSSTDASIAFSGEDGASFTCSVDGGSYSACFSPKALSGLADGLHSVAVKQSDEVGNTSDAATAFWTVVPPGPPADTTAPDAPLITTTSVASGVVRPSIEFTLAEPGGTVECRFDSEAWAACASPFIGARDLSEGGHSVEVRQADSAGNIGAADSFSFRVVVPVVPPTPSYSPATFVIAPTWWSRLRSGRWSIKAAVSTGGDRRGGAQPLTLQISTAQQPDLQLPLRASRAWKVLAYKSAFEWTGRELPRWIRVGNKAGKWTPWTRLVHRRSP
jgi:hypothetical protein